MAPAKASRPFRQHGPITIRGNGQITLPAELRRELGLGERTEVYLFHWEGDRRILLMPADEASQRMARFAERELGFTSPSTA